MFFVRIQILSELSRTQKKKRKKSIGTQILGGHRFNNIVVISLRKKLQEHRKSAQKENNKKQRNDLKVKKLGKKVKIADGKNKILAKQSIAFHLYKIQNDSDKSGFKLFFCFLNYSKGSRPQIFFKGVH